MTFSKPKHPKKILLLIRSLNIGGSERQVVSFAKTISSHGIEVHVAVKTSGGPLEADLLDCTGVILHHLDQNGMIGRLTYLWRLRKLIKSNRFDAVYGFMPVPNLALLIARTLRNRPLIAWGIRSSELDTNMYGARIKWAMRLERIFARYADRVITNSQVALVEYQAKGYPVSKLIHIPNAIDVQRFQPNPNARQKLESEIEIHPNTRIIGLFARIHPMKDHKTFLYAAKSLIKKYPNVRFLCAGEDSEGYENYAEQIRHKATSLKLENHVIWLGPRNDPEILMAACDLTTLTSNNGEGFPNSVAESLACGTPCIVTDVGDGPEIVNDNEAVVTRGDVESLAFKWLSLIQLLDKQIGPKEQHLRQSIIDRYSQEKISEKMLSQLVKQRGI